MWERWSGGVYPATLHRVIHRSPTYRVSVPFFFEPNFDARVSLLPAARRKAEQEGLAIQVGRDVVYGDFLLSKVSGNFKY
jgi:isopenicillin N synthase-like dioxygenase